MLILVKMLTTAIVQLLLAKPPCLCVVILIMSVCNLDLKYDKKKKTAWNWAKKWFLEEGKVCVIVKV